MAALRGIQRESRLPTARAAQRSRRAITSRMSQMRSAIGSAAAGVQVETGSSVMSSRVSLFQRPAMTSAGTTYDDGRHGEGDPGDAAAPPRRPPRRGLGPRPEEQGAEAVAAGDGEPADQSLQQRAPRQQRRRQREAEEDERADDAAVAERREELGAGFGCGRHRPLFFRIPAVRPNSWLWVAGRVQELLDLEHDVVGEAVHPVLAGLERLDDGVAGLAASAGARACRGTSRSSRCGRTRRSAAGASSVPPAARHSSQPSARAPASRSIWSRWVQSSLTRRLPGPGTRGLPGRAVQYAGVVADTSGSR